MIYFLFERKYSIVSLIALVIPPRIGRGGYIPEMLNIIKESRDADVPKRPLSEIIIHDV